MYTMTFNPLYGFIRYMLYPLYAIYSSAGILTKYEIREVSMT